MYNMEIYLNLSSNSGITEYKIGDNCITVRFRDGKYYSYNYQKTGSSHVEEMKSLAKKGHGLNTYINTNVKKNYAYKGSTPPPEGFC